MTAADTARIVERVLKAAGIVARVDHIHATTLAESDTSQWTK
jgi:hypothetical protein